MSPCSSAGPVGPAAAVCSWRGNHDPTAGMDPRAKARSSADVHLSKIFPRTESASGGPLSLHLEVRLAMYGPRSYSRLPSTNPCEGRVKAVS